MRHGAIVDNVVINLCEKSHDDRWWTEKNLSTNNNNKNNVRIVLGDPFPGLKITRTDGAKLHNVMKCT